MRARNRQLTSFFAVASAVALLPVAATAALSLDELPETGDAAMAYFEADPDTWLEGPVDYIILDEERKVFKGLSTTPERADFIAEFWDLRDENPEVDGNEFKRLFYERVAMANDRYHDFPRGWKSDRGFIHIVPRPSRLCPARIRIHRRCRMDLLHYGQGGLEATLRCRLGAGCHRVYQKPGAQ